MLPLRGNNRTFSKIHYGLFEIAPNGVNQYPLTVAFSIVDHDYKRISKVVFNDLESAEFDSSQYHN